MNTNREEDLLVAERAAEWLERMKAPEPHERAAFFSWLRQSPRNVREILLAMAWDVALYQKFIANDSNINTSLAELSERTRKAADKVVSIVADGQIAPPAAVNTVEMNAWQQRRVIFRRNTLLEIADEFNRYNKSPQIRVAGDELRARKFSGVFDADDPESLLMYLKSDSQLTINREGNEFVISMREGTGE